MLVVKNLSANTGNVRDTGLIPGSGIYPGEGHGNSLQRKIPKIEELGGLQSIASDMTEAKMSCTQEQSRYE